MPNLESRSDTHEISAEQAEYSRIASAPHRGGAGHVSGRRLRLAYFGVASLWGFIVGAAGILVALRTDAEMRVPSGVDLLTFVVVGAAVAIVGGGVIAGAYQESKRRR